MEGCTNEKDNIYYILFIFLLSCSKENTNEESIGFSEKVIVNFGDSLFANHNDHPEEKGISEMISNMTGCTVYDCSFGGTRMAFRPSEDIQYDRNAFSMCAIADAITSGDFSKQEQNVGLQFYFFNNVELLKSIDFNEVDMITIAFGTNDYTGGTVIEDTEDGMDTLTYTGALKYSVSKIQEKFPHIKILVITPVWRYFTDGTDSDNNNYAGTGTLREYKDALVETCEVIRIPILDSYENLSLSWDNAEYYFEDGVHLNEKGRRLYAELICGKIRNLY